MDIRQSRQKIVDLRVEEKLPLRTIAKRFGLSHERVRQILTQEGVPTSRPNKPRPRRSGKAKYHLDPKRTFQIYGCTSDEVRAIQNGLNLSEERSPARLYNLHRKRFQSHPGWDMTFPEWWELWRDHWKDRTTKDLVMVAINPDQPLTQQNAEIMTRSRRMELFWQQRRV